MTACVRARRDDGPKATRLRPSLPAAEVSLELIVREPSLSRPSFPGLPGALPLPFAKYGGRPGGRCVGVGASMLPLGDTIVSLLDELESDRESSPTPVPVPWLAEELTTIEFDDVARCRE